MRSVSTEASDAVDPSANRIASCLREADARRLHAADVHLDAGLLALRGTGLWTEDVVDRQV